MKIIIVASSPVKTFKETYHRNPSDYFIGIDGGSLELIARNIKPDVSIGDFDSTKDLQLIKENSYDTLFFPKQKAAPGHPDAAFSFQIQSHWAMAK